MTPQAILLSARLIVFRGIGLEVCRADRFKNLSLHKIHNLCRVRLDIPRLLPPQPPPQGKDEQGDQRGTEVKFCATGLEVFINGLC